MKTSIILATTLTLLPGLPAIATQDGVPSSYTVFASPFRREFIENYRKITKRMPNLQTVSTSEKLAEMYCERKKTDGFRIASLAFLNQARNYSAEVQATVLATIISANKSLCP